jgi:hypothetical protein
MPLLWSPRRRRRIAWLGGFLGVAVVVAVMVALVPNTSGHEDNRHSNVPVQRVTVDKQVPVTPARRAEIDAVFDRFVPAAVERKDPGAAYDMVTPEGHAGLTREDWRKGRLPVFEYDAKGSNFHGWVNQASYPNEMDVELDLQPRSPKQGPVAYAVTLKRVKNRWLIDTIYPRTSYAPTSPAAKTTDKTPASQQPDASIPQAKTGIAWLLIGTLVILILGAPTVFFVTQWWSGRKSRRSRFAD